MSTIACPALPYFSTLSHKWQDFRENVTEHKMCVEIHSKRLAETFLILRRYRRDIINVHWYSCIRHSCKILTKLGFSRQIFQNSSTTKFHENPPSESLVIPWGPTDMTRLINAFRQVANAPKDHQQWSQTYKRVVSWCWITTFTESTAAKRKTSKSQSSPYCKRRIFQYSRKVNPNSIHLILGLPELTSWKMQRYSLSQNTYSARELEYLPFYTPRTYFVSWII